MTTALNTAAEILQAAIEDIEAGFWCKNDLWKAFEEEVDWSSACTTRSLTEKPIGCALGLVAMYGGWGKGHYAYVGENMPYGSYERKPSRGTNVKRVRVFEPSYPNDKSPQAVKDAVQALYDAIPKTAVKLFRKEAEEDTGGEISEFEMATTVIWRYNDRSETTQKKAASWFKKALASVS